MTESNVTVIDGEKVSYEQFTVQNEVRISVWVHYKVVDHKVVVKSKSFSIDPWNKKLNCIAFEPTDWHGFGRAPSEAKREFDKWAKKYKPELVGSYTTQQFQELLSNRIKAVQIKEDKEYFKKKAEAFKKELKKLMEKYGIGIEVYANGNYSTIYLYDEANSSQGGDFTETLVDLEDVDDQAVQLLGE